MIKSPDSWDKPLTYVCCTPRISSTILEVPSPLLMPGQSVLRIKYNQAKLFYRQNKTLII